MKETTVGFRLFCPLLFKLRREETRQNGPRRVLIAPITGRQSLRNLMGSDSEELSELSASWVTGAARVD